MAARNGIPSILQVAQRLCQLVVKFTPVLTAQYPGNATLLAALTAANLACAELAAQAALVRQYGD